MEEPTMLPLMVYSDVNERCGLFAALFHYHLCNHSNKNHRGEIPLNVLHIDHFTKKGQNILFKILNNYGYIEYDTSRPIPNQETALVYHKGVPMCRGEYLGEVE